MNDWPIITPLLEVLWLAGLAAIPAVLLVELATRSVRLRPATRHALWCGVIVSFLTPLAAVIGLSARVLPTQEDLLALMSQVEMTLKAALPGAAETPAFATAERAMPFVHEHALASPTESLLASAAGSAARTSATASSVANPTFVPSAPTRSASTTALGEPAPTRHEHPNGGNTRSAGGNDGAAVAPRTARATPPGAPQLTDSQPHGAVVVRGPEIAPANESPVESPAETAGGPGHAPAATAVDQNAQHAASLTWFDRLLALRNALAKLPPLPAAPWIVGVALLVALRIGQIIRVRRVVRRADPAPDELVAMVDAVAEKLHLRRTPEALVTDARVSPMIWCGLRPCLVVPRDLWCTLDSASQRAIVMHELAHLRRCDHRLCWLAWFVGVLYWWHPVAWWARGRLHDEAEASCDAWVVALLPGARRAYAEALVHTNTYLSNNRRRFAREAGPALAVVSAPSLAGPARKLSRRIVMVMTQRPAPRPSRLGAALALALVSLCAAITPVLACPPSDGDQPIAKTFKTTKAPKIKKQQKAKTKDKADAARAEAAFVGEADALEAMRQAEAAAKLAPRSGGLGGIAVWTGDEKTPFVISGRAGGGLGPMADENGPFEGTTPREYNLSSGKLEALADLMIRNDVPIWVEPGDDAITVYATPAGHEIFAAFVRLIEPEAAATGGPFGGPRSEDTRFGVTRNPQALRELYEQQAMREFQEQLRAVELDRTQAERMAALAQREAAAQQADAAREQMESLHGHLAGSLDDDVRRSIEQALAQVHGSQGDLHHTRDRIAAKLAETSAHLARLEAQLQALEDELEALDDEADADAPEAPELFDPRSPRSRAPQPPMPPVPPVAPVHPVATVHPVAPVHPVTPVPSVAPIVSAAPAAIPAPPAPSSASIVPAPAR